MINKYTKTLSLILIAAGCFYFVLTSANCDYFQKKTFTDPDDCKARYFELCLKGQKADKASAGGNTLICDDLQEQLTDKGKLKNFKSCFDWENTNKEKLKKQYPEFDCFDIIYNSECI